MKIRKIEIKLTVEGCRGSITTIVVDRETPSTYHFLDRTQKRLLKSNPLRVRQVTGTTRMDVIHVICYCLKEQTNEAMRIVKERIKREVKAREIASKHMSEHYNQAKPNFKKWKNWKK